MIMDYEEIYEILSEKSVSTHYLGRYVRFIRSCLDVNIGYSGYMEEHHICPKASDMFPQYANLVKYEWNSVKLTARQHIIAHVMLWKIFGGSQSISIHYMLNVQNESTKYNMRKVPTSTYIRYAAKSREEFAQYRLGKATFKDSEGNRYFLDVNDPKIVELGLVGHNHGMIVSAETRQLMRDAKFPNKVVKLYFLNNVVIVKLFSDEFDSYIAQGWSTTKSEDDYAYAKECGNELLADYWTGRSRYGTQDGVYHGAYLSDDPIIKELNLVHYKTDKQMEQFSTVLELATAAKLGTQIYNNGVEEKFLREPIDSTWVLGRLERSQEWETKRISKMKEKVVGSKIYTNGKENMFVQEGDIIPEGFYLGMKFRDNSVYNYTNAERNVLLEFNGPHIPPKDMVRIVGKEKINALKKKLGM